MSDDGVGPTPVPTPVPGAGQGTDDHVESMWAGRAKILVVVRPRKILDHDRSRRNLLSVLDNKVMVIKDPGNPDDVVGKMRNRNREKRYAFDYVFDPVLGMRRVA